VCKAGPAANEQHRTGTKMMLKYGGSEHGTEEPGALDSMLRSGVTADGSTSTEKNKKMMTQISQLGPRTPARRGKRTATLMDVDSLLFLMQYPLLLLFLIYLQSGYCLVILW
jgi:hypothetical protein